MRQTGPARGGKRHRHRRRNVLAAFNAHITRSGEHHMTSPFRSRGRGLAALPIAIACALPALPAVAQDAPADDTQTLDRIQVTGSRIRRADIEGAVPLTVIDRAAIDASGDVSVADVLRDSTFSSFGNFRPQSGSSAQATADIDLRGIGSDRTLVLV